MKSPPLPLNGHTIVQARDIETAERELSRCYLPLRLRSARSDQPQVTRLNTIDLGKATVGAIRFENEVRILTEEASNFHVDLPLSGHSVSRVGSTRQVVTTQGAAQVFMPGEAADLQWSANTQQLCVMIDKTAVEHHLTTLLGAHLFRPLTFESTMNLRSPGGATWMQALKLVDLELRHEHGLLAHEITRRTLERVLIESLLLGQQHNYSRQLRTRGPDFGKGAIGKAIELLETHPERPWTAGELAAAVGLSVRGLHAGFRTKTEGGPMTYLRLVRLARTHADLVQAEPTMTTVSAVARRWGFTHLGRFAAAYSARYGVSPSTTLRAATSAR